MFRFGTHLQLVSGLGDSSSPFTYAGGSFMSYMEAIKSGFSNYAKFNGRASRSEFWWFFLFYAVVIFIVNFIVDLTGLPIIISVLVWASFVLPMLGLYFRRLHDVDRSAWWILIALIPLIGSIVLIVFWATPGTEGDNRFGPPTTTAVN